MFAITQPSLLKSTNQIFFGENLQKIIEKLSESFYVSLGKQGLVFVY